MQKTINGSIFRKMIIAGASLLEQNKFADIEVIKDLAGHDRVVCGRRI